MIRSLAFTALCVLVSAAFGAPAYGQSIPVSPPTASPAPPPAEVAPGSALVGWYVMTREAADTLQVMTLHLRGDGVVSLKTSPLGIDQTATGTPAGPEYQTGTWAEKNGQATVNFDMTSNIVDGVPTDQRHEALEVAFTLSGCTLKLAADPAKTYGTTGLVFAKQQCTP